MDIIYLRTLASEKGIYIYVCVCVSDIVYLYDIFELNLDWWMRNINILEEKLNGERGLSKPTSYYLLELLKKKKEISLIGSKERKCFGCNPLSKLILKGNS